MSSIELLDPEPDTTALTVPQRAALALGSDKARTSLTAMVKMSEDIKEVKNQPGREQCHAAAMVLVRARTNIERIGKASRDDATKFSKAVIAEEKELLAITAPEEARLLALRDAWDNARAAEKAEADRIERARITLIHQRIADIKAMAMLALECRTSAKVEDLIDKLAAIPVDGFEEFAEEAALALEKTTLRMKEISAQRLAEEQQRARVKQEQEAEAARLAAERAALDLQRAEMERQRVEDAERDAAARADADRLAADLERTRKELEQARADLVEVERANDAREDAKRLEARDFAQIAAMQELREISLSLCEQPQEAQAVREIAVEAPAVQDLVSAPALFADPGPTDAQIVEVAVTAVANQFGIPESVALERLSAVRDWPDFY